MAIKVMSIPELLWGVQRRKGYGSIAEMARGEGIPQATMYAWMTGRRLPDSAASLRIVARITGQPVEDLARMVSDEELSH